MTIKEQIIDLRNRGLLYPEIVDSLGCTYEYVKDTCRKNNLGYSKYELAKSSGRFKPYKDWQKAVDDYYGGSGIAEVIDQHRSSNGETKVTVRCVKCGDYSITLNELYERDNGICKLCGHPCDWEDYTRSGETFIAGDYYPSIDHIKPLSKGGEHNWSNVQLAHRICNSIKSDR